MSLWRFGRGRPPKDGNGNVFLDRFPMQPEAADFDRLTLGVAFQEVRK